MICRLFAFVAVTGMAMSAFPGKAPGSEIPKESPHARTPTDVKHKDSIKVGEKVPELSVRTLDGMTVKLSELQKDAKRAKSGVVVLSFWCTTCGSCRRVEHRLDKLAKDYEGRVAVMALDANA